MNIAELEWNGETYELKYTFGVINRLRGEGVNVPAIVRDVRPGGQGQLGDYTDVMAIMLAFLLREAGARVTAAQVWERMKGNADLQAEAFNLFYWLVGEHYAGPETVKKPSAEQPATTEPEKPATST